MATRDTAGHFTCNIQASRAKYIVLQKSYLFVNVSYNLNFSHTYTCMKLSLFFNIFFQDPKQKLAYILSNIDVKLEEILNMNELPILIDKETVQNSLFFTSNLTTNSYDFILLPTRVSIVNNTVIIFLESNFVLLFKTPSTISLLPRVCFLLSPRHKHFHLTTPTTQFLRHVTTSEKC